MNREYIQPRDSHSEPASLKVITLTFVDTHFSIDDDLTAIKAVVFWGKCVEMNRGNGQLF
ncbi:hypothetical protein DPMN_138164 [Dreissena polymorpha]|uniref:Uncharacterized protein n=1 Tax=Dreissena polymorpha TaxID=45954 RepID=A0A9D4G3A2_DREPO|nr:hypothetical protein DPMN_138164 [Dreissena polymorpha]